MHTKRVIPLSIALLFVIFCSAASKGETIYFLVAEIIPYHGDSYILPLTEPNDIAYARNLVQYGYAFGPHIVVADIAAGSGGINCDYFSPAKQQWSWHVTQFRYFAAYTIEIWDGWPSWVESDLQYWLGIGTIGFWSYTVVAELGIDPERWKRDFVPDYQIDFEDYAVLANNWLNQCTNPLWCSGTDLDKNGVVNMSDLQAFTESWLSPFTDMWFVAWNWPYQCYGDADNSTQSGYRIYSGDHAIVQGVASSGCGWPCTYPDPRYDPRADFNRDFKVYDDDVAILNANYKKKDSSFSQTCSH